MSRATTKKSTKRLSAAAASYDPIAQKNLTPFYESLSQPGVAVDPNILKCAIDTLRSILSNESGSTCDANDLCAPVAVEPVAAEPVAAELVAAELVAAELVAAELVDVAGEPESLLTQTRGGQSLDEWLAEYAAEPEPAVVFGEPESLPALSKIDESTSEFMKFLNDILNGATTLCEPPMLDLESSLLHLAAVIVKMMHYLIERTKSANCIIITDEHIEEQVSKSLPCEECRQPFTTIQFSTLTCKISALCGECHAQCSADNLSINLSLYEIIEFMVRMGYDLLVSPLYDEIMDAVKCCVLVDTERRKRGFKVLPVGDIMTIITTAAKYALEEGTCLHCPDKSVNKSVDILQFVNGVEACMPYCSECAQRASDAPDASPTGPTLNLSDIAI